MFDRSAHIYDLLYGWKDYAAEAARINELILDAVPDARTLLDVACGTGKHLEHLRATYDVEGLDIDSQLLEIAEQRNPGVPLHRADMERFRLGKQFDAVTCLFSSIGYVQTTERLTETIINLTAHVSPGGVLLLEPWFSPDQWEDGHIGALFVDQPDLKVARMNLGESHDRVSVLDFHYLVATPSGISHFTERHSLGLFTRHEYQRAFDAAGLIRTYDDWGLEGRGLYIGKKPLQPPC